MEQPSTLLYSNKQEVDSKQRIERLTRNLTEAAQVLGVSRSHIYSLASQNKLPGLIRLGKRLVISKHQLEKHLNGEGNANAKG